MVFSEAKGQKTTLLNVLRVFVHTYFINTTVYKGIYTTQQLALSQPNPSLLLHHNYGARLSA